MPAPAGWVGSHKLAVYIARLARHLGPVEAQHVFPSLGDELSALHLIGQHPLKDRAERRCRDRDSVERVEHVVADPAQEGPLAVQTQAPGLPAQLRLGGAGAGDHEAHPAELFDHRRERVEREVEALLVHESPDQQHEPLVRLAVPGPELAQIAGHRHQVARIDPVLDRRDPGAWDTEHARHVASHVPRAGDHTVSVTGHVPFGGVNLRLRVLLHHPWWRPNSSRER